MDDVSETPDMNNYDEQNEEDVFTVGNTKSKSPMASIIIQGMKVQFVIDTGASVNIIDEKTFLMLKARPNLEKVTSSLFAYGADHPIKLTGKFQTAAESKNNIVYATFHIATGNHGCLLSYQTAPELNLIRVDVNSVNAVQPITVDDLVKSHPALFNGIGKLKNFQVKCREIGPLYSGSALVCVACFLSGNFDVGRPDLKSRRVVN